MASYLSFLEDDGLPSVSTDEQVRTEDACREVFESWLNPDGSLSRES